MKLVKQQKEQDKMARIFYKKYGGQKKRAHANEGQLLHNFIFIHPCNRSGGSTLSPSTWLKASSPFVPSEDIFLFLITTLDLTKLDATPQAAN